MTITQGKAEGSGKYQAHWGNRLAISHFFWTFENHTFQGFDCVKVSHSNVSTKAVFRRLTEP